MKLNKSIATAVLVGAACFAGTSHAARLDYVFGDFLSGDSDSYPSNPEFARLTVDTGTGPSDTWSFWLHGINLDGFFGEQSFLGALAVDGLAGTVKVTDFESNSGISKVGVQAIAGGPGGVFDFRFDLTDRNQRVETGEYVKWSATGISAITGYAAHIQGIGMDGEGSAWYQAGEVPAPVPLPATFWLVASALVSFAGWRKYAKPDDTDARGSQTNA